MSRIPMAIASTLVVLAALGVAHLLVFRGSSSTAEAAPPQPTGSQPSTNQTSEVVSGVANDAPPTQRPVAASPFHRSPAIQALYRQARAQMRAQAHAGDRVCTDLTAEACAAKVAPLECCQDCPCDGLAKRGAIAVHCHAGEAPWWTCGEIGTFAVNLVCGRGHSDDNCCGFDEESFFGLASNRRGAPCTSEEAKKIDDFAATDEYPLGRIGFDFGAWIQLGNAQICPLCRTKEFCQECRGACECGAACECPAPLAGSVSGLSNSANLVRQDNCPGAELEGRPYQRTPGHDNDDRHLAEQISQIEEIRRERNRSLFQGTLLAEDDENETSEFKQALRLVAGIAQVAEGENAPPAEVLPEGAPLPGSADPVFPGSPDPVLVDVLRQAGRMLDLRSHDLEDVGRYGEADQLRALAQAVRHEARKAGSGGEGGCGLFCPAIATKPMCAPAVERSAKRRPEISKDGPVEGKY